MNKESAAEGWIKAAEELPEEGTTVLVYLGSDAITLGLHFEGKWKTAVALWDSAIRGDADVLFWRHLPWPSTEMLTPSDAGGVSASEVRSPIRPAAFGGGCCRRQAAEIDVRARVGTDGTGAENSAGGSEEDDIVGRPYLPSADNSHVMNVSNASALNVSNASALRSPAMLDNVSTIRRALEHSFSIGSDDLFAGYPEASSVRCFDASFVDYDLDDLGAQADAVDSYDDFEAFLVNLLRSSQANRSRYRDAPVWPFLDALLWCLEEFDHYFYGRAPRIPGRPSWKLLGQLLFIALFRDTPEANRWMEDASLISADLRM